MTLCSCNQVQNSIFFLYIIVQYRDVFLRKNRVVKEGFFTLRLWCLKKNVKLFCSMITGDHIWSCDNRWNCFGPCTIAPHMVLAPCTTFNSVAIFLEQAPKKLSMNPSEVQNWKVVSGAGTYLLCMLFTRYIWNIWKMLYTLNGTEFHLMVKSYHIS